MNEEDLLQAAESGDIDELTRLLNEGVDVTCAIATPTILLIY